MPPHGLHPPGNALQAVLLDVDGTLIDSNDAHARAWMGALAEHGYIVPFEQVRPLIGMGGDKLLPTLAGLDPESGEADRIAGVVQALFSRELPSLRPTNGARALLERLRQDGLELVVATSAAPTVVQAILRQAGVADLIEDTASAGDAERSKPDPDILQAALRKSGRHPGQCIMIGDTPYDIEAASRARIPTIALRCGGWWTDADFRGALSIYSDPGDLCRNVGTSPFGARDR